MGLRTSSRCNSVKYRPIVNFAKCDQRWSFEPQTINFNSLVMNPVWLVVIIIQSSKYALARQRVFST